MSRSMQSSEDSMTILEKIGKLKLTSTETSLVSLLLSNTELVTSIQSSSNMILHDTGAYFI